MPQEPQLTPVRHLSYGLRRGFDIATPGSRTTRGRNGSASSAIVTAGLVCGVLDIAYVFLVFGWQNGRAARTLRGIAVSVLGPGASSSGAGGAALGLALHFGVATAAAALFYVLSRRVRALVRHPWIGGALFGVGFYLLMNLVVLRLTRIPGGAFPPPGWHLVLAAHVLCVGWPIAWIVRRMEPRSSAPR